MTQEEEETEETAGAVSVSAYKVSANGALSEYLAVNMMNGSTAISLEDFPESADQEYLLDSWEEAVYQNPMVLGVESALCRAAVKR